MEESCAGGAKVQSHRHAGLFVAPSAWTNFASEAIPNLYGRSCSSETTEFAGFVVLTRNYYVLN
jgi:hypothetical protein